MSIKKIDEAFELALKQGIFPGAAVAVVKNGKVLLKECYGFAEKIPVERKLTFKHYFDIASLTKPMATAMVAMVLLEEGKLNLDEPVGTYFKRYKKEPYTPILVKHLLQHTAGLPAYKPYFERLSEMALGGTPLEEIKKDLFKYILSEGLNANTRIGSTRLYSDLGYILMGDILEQVGGKSLDKLFLERVAKPLKLNDTFFVPLNTKTKLPRTDFASTSKSSLRRKILSGEVEDEHAWLLNGVAGHAGLFSTLPDMMKWADELLKINEGKSKFLKKETLHRFADVKPPLGWDKPTEEKSQAGEFFPKTGIGHLGFTGCSIWMDLYRKFYIILLTNRVHPYRYNEDIKHFRPKIQDLIIQSLKLVR